MKNAIWLAVAVVLLTGCGYDPNKPVYDTTANPEGFPAEALNIINGVEGGGMASYDAVTAAFGELYVNRPDLLDNAQWQRVVNLLGVKFRLRGDGHVAQGVSGFEDAFKMYTLAAYARPQDERTESRKLLFEVWDKAVRDSVVSGAPLANLSAAAQLATVKYFMLGDSLQRQFGRDYLWPQAFSVDSIEAAYRQSSAHPLSMADRCFLSVVGFRRFSGLGKMATFAEPQVDLVSARITPQAGNWYAAELYFSPREPLKCDYLVAFRVSRTDSTQSAGIEQLSLDFHPQQQTRTWKPKNLNVAYRRFLCSGRPRSIEIGLYDLRADSAHFLPLRDSGRPLFTLPDTVFSVR